MPPAPTAQPRWLLTSSSTASELADRARHHRRNAATGPSRRRRKDDRILLFARAPDLQLVFGKRALHPGAAIGYHRQEEDEIYYIVSGTGELTLNGARSVVGPGTAILTRPGSSHGLRQVGPDDLVIIIVYQQSSGVRGR